MADDTRKLTLEAARHMDWMQVVLNGGHTCFRLMPDGRFCGRHERWAGHDGEDPHHEFVSLADLLVQTEERDPLRQLWPEVVEALGESNRLALVPTTEYGPPSKRAQIRERQELAATIDRLLTRIRAITPEGGHNGAGAPYDTHDWPGSRQQWSGPKPCQRCGVLSDDPGAEEPCRKAHPDPITTPEGGGHDGP